MTNKRYPCTQRELYAVCASAWDSCHRNLEEFAKFRPVYTNDFIEGKLREIVSVSRMPHRTSRSAEQQLSRLVLMNKLAECHAEWKKLKLALSEIWPEDELNIHYKAMGQSFYADSHRFKWEACTGLMETALAYVQNNAEILQASPLLGPSFAEEFKVLTRDLNERRFDYLEQMKLQGIGGSEKVKASSKLYSDLMLMFADAKIVFRDDPDTLKHFFFDVQLNLVSGQGGAGIKGSINSGKVPINQLRDLKLTLLENDDEAFVDEEGSYRFSQLAAGSYTMEVKATGYKTLVIPDIRVNTGAFHIENIRLELIDLPPGD
jgi:hypothetical protein